MLCCSPSTPSLLPPYVRLRQGFGAHGRGAGDVWMHGLRNVVSYFITDPVRELRIASSRPPRPPSSAETARGCRGSRARTRSACVREFGRSCITRSEAHALLAPPPPPRLGAGDLWKHGLRELQDGIFGSLPLVPLARRLRRKQRGGVGGAEQERDPPAARGSRNAHFNTYYGTCPFRMLVGTLPPMFSRMGSRSLAPPVYFTVPSRLQSSGK